MSAGSKGLDDFLAEAGEIIEVLSRDILTLDQQRGREPDPELVNGIFRAAHSLKGLSAMFAQDRVTVLAHRAEDLLDQLRLGKVALTDATLDALVEMLDVFQVLLGEASRGESTEVVGARAEFIARQLAALASPPPKEEEQDPLDRLDLDPQLRMVFTEYEEHRLRENVRKGVALYRVRAAFDLSDFDQGLSELNARIKKVGEVISTLPSAQPGDGTGIGFDLIVGSQAGRADVEDAVRGLPAQVSEIALRSPPKPRRKEGKKKREQPLERAQPPPGEPAPQSAPSMPSPERPSAVRAVPPPPEGAPEAPPPESSLRSLTQTVRVDIGRLDFLMNTVGELLLIKNNVHRLAEAAVHGGAHAISKLWGQELQREGRQLERKLDDLQQGLLDARMVPLGQVFDKLARLVRRIAREAGKEIDFSVSGGDVELDKLIVEELSDPLMHIIRNAIDHGVERPELRVERGKPRRAVISLTAAQQGNHVVVSISDDGAGIDEKRVREVAISRGVITAQQGAELSRRELQNLIFAPGFSTARSISELSGRGVGLDVVKTNIAHLSGIIDLSSEPGVGTTFTLTLPVTLAIIRALVVSVSGRTYAIPLNSVLEILAVTPGEVRTIERREVVSVRGQTLPLTRLARLFGHPESPREKFFVVVIGLAQERLGVTVDELLGQQDIVTQPLGARLKHVRGISGATDLGNRRTVLVLDVGELIEENLAVAPTAARK